LSGRPGPPLPRVLLVEDDPASRAFLAAAVRDVPAEVETAGSLAEALGLAAEGAHDLWLFDAHLPDGSGSQLLQALRAQHGAVPALAHTASEDRPLLDALSAAGFDGVLVKPMPADTLQAAIRGRLGLTGDAAPAPVWDDEAAASALNGDRAHVEALRRLFLSELPHQCGRIVASAHTGDIGAMRAELHRLRASCGFVGAARLGGAVAALSIQPEQPDALADFTKAVEETGVNAKGG
jgi:CheY-like chemotaxis protein/HPt (histidine-containing phosphotransfer) domain-containing protein